MSMMIFFTQYAVHIVYNVPDLSSAAQAVKDTYAAQTADGSISRKFVLQYLI